LAVLPEHRIAVLVPVDGLARKSSGQSETRASREDGAARVRHDPESLTDEVRLREPDLGADPAPGNLAIGAEKTARRRIGEVVARIADDR